VFDQYQNLFDFVQKEHQSNQGRIHGGGAIAPPKT